MVKIEADLQGLQDLLNMLVAGRVTHDKVSAIFTLLEQTMTPELTRLTASVTALETQAESLIALVQGLAQLIRNNANDPAALIALADSADAEAAAIAKAVTDNTPPAA